MTYLDQVSLVLVETRGIQLLLLASFPKSSNSHGCENVHFSHPCVVSVVGIVQFCFCFRLVQTLWHRCALVLRKQNLILTCEGDLESRSVTIARQVLAKLQTTTFPLLLSLVFTTCDAQTTAAYLTPTF